MAKANTPILLDELTAITPLDGRYRKKLQELSDYTSEYSLIRIRVEVEVKYLFELEKAGIVRKFSVSEKKILNVLLLNLDIDDVREIKHLEEKTRHDVKAMERWLRSRLENTSLVDIIEYIHFGITSWDINNIVHSLQLQRATRDVILPTLKEALYHLIGIAEGNKSIPMLARTHGQPAVPTTLGKEMVIFADRLSRQIEILERHKLTAKFNGAVGNYNALFFSYPGIDWINLSKEFVESFDLEFNPTTNQINSYDSIAEYLQVYQRINNILTNFDQDIWRYISDEWFVQVAKVGEVGSSTMPQKINPIDFENSEGNLGLANSILQFMSQKLSISRLQRDLSDSTVMRNLGVGLGYSLLGYKSILTGLSRIRPNFVKIEEELNRDWTILGEGAQTLFRKNGVKDPYSLISGLTRGKHISQKEWVEFVDSLSVDEKSKDSLRTLNPQNYLGLAQKITENTIKDIKKRNGISH